MKKMLLWKDNGITVATPTHLDRNRIRFNWGYHDGRAEARNGLFRSRAAGWKSDHHDPVYVQGWKAGYNNGAGTTDETSEPAWTASGIEDGFSPFHFTAQDIAKHGDALAKRHFPHSRRS